MDLELVSVEDGVDAEVLGAQHGVADLGAVGVLRLQLDGDADRSAHGGDAMAAARGNGGRGAGEPSGLAARAARAGPPVRYPRAAEEDSPSGLWRTLGKRVG